MAPVNILRSVQEIPIVYRHIFQQFDNFNRMQSEVMNDVLYSDKCIVVSAPTGSGKTVILELAIIRLLKQLEDAQYKEDFKIIYMAPIKALCNEITSEWQKKFQQLGLSCGSVTGDDNDFDVCISKYKIIITTPEKWDSMSRKWNGCVEYMKTIKLFMIDEVHLLNEDKRGPILEAVVSRMKTIRTKINKQHNLTEKIRFVAVSATIPNITDLATWLGDKESTVYHKISDDLRPVKLEKHVFGYPNSQQQTAFRFDMNLTYKLPSIINKYCNGKPVLIFCNSRKSTEMAATAIVGKVQLSVSDERRQNFSTMSNQIQDSKLRTSISNGIAFHHAGLCVSDRKLVEENFRQSSIPILFSTNTLAMGVNLPAYLVIIKSTEMIVPGGAHELSEAVILQMIGRAGRPQFDVHGVAVIMTQNNKVKQYENLITGSAPIESHLHKHLVEHLNSEIVSQTISSIDLVVQWIRSTYLYIRAIQNPFHYDLPKNAAKSFVEKKLEDLCVNAINELVSYGLVTKENLSMKATNLGQLMAHYYLSFKTMKHFTKITGSENIEKIFEILITCPDYFDGYHLRVDDKRILNDLNSNSRNDLIRFPIQGKIKTTTDKISCLMQAVLGNIVITDQSLTEEAAQMIKLGQRMGRAMQEYIATLDKKNNFNALVSMMLLLKALHVNLWDNSPYIFKQCKKIGSVYSKILESKGKTTFESIVNMKPSDIEMILRKNPPFGTDFLDTVAVLPKYTLDMELKDDHVYVIVKQINPKFVCDPLLKGVTLIVGDSMNETLYINHSVQYFLIKYGKFERTIQLKNPSTFTVTGHLINNGIVGLDKSSEIILRHNEPVIEFSDENEPKAKVSKRKSTTKARGRKKQSRISEYLTEATKPKKRSNNSDTTNEIAGKKAKNDDALGDTLINQNDVIELSDESSVTAQSTELDKINSNLEKVNEMPNQRLDNDLSIESIQNYKAPEKKVFKHIRSGASLKDFLSDSLYNDITSQSQVIQSQSNINQNQTDDVIPPRKVKFTYIAPPKHRKPTDGTDIQLQTNDSIRSHLTELQPNEPPKTVERNEVQNVPQSMMIPRTFVYIPPHKDRKPAGGADIQLQRNDVIRSHLTELQPNEPSKIVDRDEEQGISSTMIIPQKKSVEQPISFNGKNDAKIHLNISSQPKSMDGIGKEKATKLTFVPSCIKAVFGKTYTQQFDRVPLPEEKLDQKKDIKFSYDHLLTPITLTNETSNSQLKSLHDVIDEQQKLRRIPSSSSVTVFPFRDLCITNFSAAKALERIEQMKCVPDDENEIFLISSETNKNSSILLDTSLDSLLDEQQKLNERQKIINEQIQQKTAVTNQMGTIERKQSKHSQLPSAFPLNGLSTHSVGLSKLQIDSTQQWNEFFDIPMMPNNKSEHEMNSFNLHNVNSFENFDRNIDYLKTSKNWVSSNRTQCVNSNMLNRNDYEQHRSQPSSFIPCGVGNKMQTSPSVYYSAMSNNFSSQHIAYSMEPDHAIKLFSYDNM